MKTVAARTAQVGTDRRAVRIVKTARPAVAPYLRTATTYFKML
jgi:hypothetical protein